MRVALAILVVALVALVVTTLWPGGSDPTDSDLAAAAAHWVGAGTPHQPRRDGDEWEVDVIRPDGSVVEVTLGGERQLRSLDEERGPDRSPAPDELAGAARERAARAALEVAGPGTVQSVERESGGLIEVGIRRDGDRVEVALDRRLRVLEVEQEDPDDE
ncbi:MAG: hypothetical protein ACRDSN_16075 [Pseudonocardiaceae bacterium]